MAASKFGNRREFFRYLVSGLTAVATDLIVYALLLGPLGPSPAKTWSFIIATCVAYTLNKFWTFKRVQHSWKEMGKFAGLYSISLLLNVIVNRTVIYMLDFKIPILKQFDVQLAWLCATGASTVFNYVGQKFWVFKTIVGEKVDLTSVGQSSKSD